MALHTFEVRWKHTDGQIKSMRLFTRDEESCLEYLLNNHTRTFVYILSCEQEPDKTVYCKCCGQETSSNYIGGY